MSNLKENVLAKVKMALAGEDNDSNDNAKRAGLSLGLFAIGLIYPLITHDTIGGNIITSVAALTFFAQIIIGASKAEGKK